MKQINLQSPRNTCLYSLGKTNTFRAAASSLFEWKPHFAGYGCNLQNVSKQGRQMYIPDNGYKFIQVDQAGAEALIVAYLCDAGKYRDLFIHNVSPHVYVALHMFKDKWVKRFPELDFESACLLPPASLKEHPQWKSIVKAIKSSDDWPAEERYYYLAKQTGHSANYGIRTPTFIMNVLDKSQGQIALSNHDGNYFLGFYRSTFPEIVKWNYSVVTEARTAGVLYNLFGHPRVIFEWEKDNEIIAFKAQSTVGEITHVAYRDCQGFIEREDKDWHLLNNDHDSFLIEVPVNECSAAIPICQSFIEQEFTSPNDGAKFRMKSEAKSGMNWNSFHEKKNPYGLQ